MSFLIHWSRWSIPYPPCVKVSHTPSTHRCRCCAQHSSWSRVLTTRPSYLTKVIFATSKPTLVYLAKSRWIVIRVAHHTLDTHSRCWLPIDITTGLDVDYVTHPLGRRKWHVCPCAHPFRREECIASLNCHLVPRPTTSIRDICRSQYKRPRSCFHGNDSRRAAAEDFGFRPLVMELAVPLGCC